MSSSGGGTDADRRCPRLAPGWEKRAVDLDPAEGFLLSRIDGYTPWAMLRQIGGLSAEEVDLALESWIRAGLVLVDASAPPPRPPAGPAGVAPQKEPKPALDPSLDLEVAFQREVLAFEARLPHASYHEILGVARGAEPRQIKLAYFQLSKRFHPDRYFRRNLGPYAKRLERIFEHLALAYELLSDPATRAEIESGMESAPAGAQEPAPESAAPDAAGPPRGYRPPTRMENLERLRKRFKMPAKLVAERRFKAGQFHDAARAAAHGKRWLEAAASARLAIAFDPWNDEYKRHFASLQADVHAARATDLLQQAEGADARGDALRLLEEAIHYRPADAALQARAAQLAFEIGDLERAREFAASACQLEPETADHHLVYCRALRRSGDLAAAKRALQAAAALSPGHPDLAAEQKLLRRTR
jgi:curved DNA-binding protein CbpA